MKHPKRRKPDPSVGSMLKALPTLALDHPAPPLRFFSGFSYPTALLLELDEPQPKPGYNLDPKHEMERGVQYVLLDLCGSALTEGWSPADVLQTQYETLFLATLMEAGTSSWSGRGVEEDFRHEKLVRALLKRTNGIPWHHGCRSVVPSLPTDPENNWWYRPLQVEDGEERYVPADLCLEHALKTYLWLLQRDILMNPLRGWRSLLPERPLLDGEEPIPLGE